MDEKNQALLDAAVHGTGVIEPTFEVNEETVSSKSPFEVTEETFAAAVNGASYWARKRLWKKMGKVKWRAAEWRGEVKPMPSPLNPNYTIYVLNRNKFHGVVKNPLPPADLERWVENFVYVNHTKGKAREKS